MAKSWVCLAWTQDLGSSQHVPLCCMGPERGFCSHGAVPSETKSSHSASLLARRPADLIPMALLPATHPFCIHQESPPEEVHAWPQWPWPRFPLGNGQESSTAVLSIPSGVPRPPPPPLPLHPILARVRRGGLTGHRAWGQAPSPFQSRLSRELGSALLSFQVAEVSERSRLLPPQTPWPRVPVPSGLDLQGVSGPGTYMLGVGVREGRWCRSWV